MTDRRLFSVSPIMVLVSGHRPKEPVDPVKLTELLEHEIKLLMMENCAPVEAGAQPNREPGKGPTKKPCAFPPPFSSSSASGCSPETKRKLSKEEILKAIVECLPLKCPEYTGDKNHPCGREPNVFTFCDGFAVSFGVLCPTILDCREEASSR